MLKLVAGLIGSLLLALALAVGERVWGPLSALVRMAFYGLAALLGLVGLTILLLGLSQEAGWAMILGGMIAATGGLLALAVRRARRRLAAALAGSRVPRATGLAPDPRWRRLDQHLGWAERQRTRLARERIESFLAERQSESLTGDHRQLLISCEKRVPELIDACLERCARARPEERHRYLEETLGRLSQLGEEAERAREEVRAADDRRLQTLHRYFDGVAPAGDPVSGSRAGSLPR